MNKSIMLLALLGASFSAMADDSVLKSAVESAKANTYVGASMGVAHISEGSDRNDATLSLTAGTKFCPNFGVEAEYAYLNNVKNVARLHAFDVAGKAYYDVTPKVEVSAKVGAALTLADNRKLPTDGWGVSWVVGAGAAYKYTDDIALTADVTHYTNIADNSFDVTTLTAGVKYKF